MLTKKSVLLPLFLLAALCAAGCSGAGSKAPAARQEGKTAVVYFSHSGNTQKLAQIIAADTGADIYRILPVKAYPEDCREVVSQAKAELENNSRPEIHMKLQDLGSYDNIFLGFPIWWHTMPMPVFTFLEKYDLSGKTIIPFATHEGSAFGRSLEDIRRAAPGARLLEGLEVRGSRVSASEKQVISWLHDCGF